MCFFWVSLTFITIFIFMSYRVALIQASLCCQFVRWIAVLKLCKHLFDAIKNGYVNAACKDKEEQTERKMRIMEIAFITLPGCFKSVAWDITVFTNFWPYSVHKWSIIIHIHMLYMVFSCIKYHVLLIFNLFLSRCIIK